MDEITLKEYVLKYNRKAEILDIISVKQFSSQTYQTNTIYKEKPLRLSKTAKVIIQGNYRCISCNLVATHVVICKDKGSQVYSARFFGYSNETGWNIFTKDHILPKSEDGRDSYKNLQCMCYSCNQEKASDTTEADNMEDHERHELSKMAAIGSYDQTKEKLQDFKRTRERIRKLIKNLPWYMRLFGVHKLIEKRLLKPLEDKGYTSNGS